MASLAGSPGSPLGAGGCASGTAHYLQYANHERVNSIHEKQALLLAGRECTRCARVVPFGPVSLFTIFLLINY